MPMYQITRLLRHKDSGWSEVWWTEQADAEAAGQAGLLVNRQMMKLMVPGVTLAALRLSLVGEPRASTHLAVPLAEQKGDFSVDSTTLTMNLASDAVLLTLKTPFFRFKNRKFVRGVPDNLFSDNEFSRNAYATWISNITGPNGLAFHLNDSNFKTRCRPGNGLGGWVYHDITSVVIERATIRRVGRPFALPVGRRRRRA